MALVAILIKDEDDDVTVDIRSDSEMPEDEADLTPAQALSIVMTSAAFAQSDIGLDLELADESDSSG